MQTNISEIQPGWAAYDQAGEQIGEVADVGPNYVHVRKGMFFPKDLYIPASQVSSIDGSKSTVWVAALKQDVETIGWDDPPTGTAWEGSGTTTTEDSITVPLREERVEAESYERDAGEVTVGKRVVEQQQDVEVPVTHDEVEVTRRRVDRPADAGDEVIDDGETIRVPLRAEEVDVRKDARVVEEVEVKKRPVTDTRRVSETVRREEVDVDQTGDTLAGTGASRITRSNYDTAEGDDLADAAPEATGAAAGAMGGAAVGGVVGGPPGAVVGGVAGAAGGALAGDKAEDVAEEAAEDQPDPYRS
jgi:uncharacterized protein (TIGR02271 family)